MLNVPDSSDLVGFDRPGELGCQVDGIFPCRGTCQVHLHPAVGVRDVKPVTEKRVFRVIFGYIYFQASEVSMNRVH